MRLVIGPVRDGAHGGKWYAIVKTHLCYGSTFHLDRQHVMTCRMQVGAQAGGIFGTGHKSVATGHQPGMNTRLGDQKIMMKMASSPCQSCASSFQ